MAILKMKYGVISADDHVQEAPDVWTKRMSKAKFGDDIPTSSTCQTAARPGPWAATRKDSAAWRASLA